MTAGVGAILSQARSALTAAQVGLNTTAKNVSNVNTEGYSRQRVEFITGNPERYGVHPVGGGVVVQSINRTTNEFLTKRIIDESNALGKHEGVSTVLGQLEVLFKEDGEVGVSGIVSQFFNDLRTLSTQPDSVPLRAAVRESAEGVTNRFRNLSQGVEQVITDLDRRIEGSVAQINDLTNLISNLNRQIMEIEVRGPAVVAADERDARDMAIAKLSKLVDVQVTEIENGGISVASGRLGPLVSATDRVELAAYRSDEGTHPGSVRVFLKGSHVNIPPRDVTDYLKTGTMGGYLQVRDEMIPGIEDKLDSLAFNLTQEINNIHKGSYNRNNETGLSFFSDLDTVKGAAKSLSLSESVKGDLLNIATAVSPNAAGDNRAALAMADLQEQPLFEGGRASFSDLASGVVGTIGIQTRAANESFETQKGLVDQLENFRKEVTSVSLDEEAMDMIKYQKLFEASAKMIQVGDSLLDTVMNLKRF